MPLLTVLPDDIVLPVHDGETILAAVVRDGFRYHFGCRRGGCGECKVELVDGSVEYERRIAATVLTAEERDRGVCLSCRAVPVTDVVVRLRAGDKFECRSTISWRLAQRELDRRVAGGVPELKMTNDKVEKGAPRWE